MILLQITQNFTWGMLMMHFAFSNVKFTTNISLTFSILFIKTSILRLKLHLIACPFWEISVIQLHQVLEERRAWHSIFFLHRAKLICLPVSLFREEVEKLMTMFIQNYYSHSFLKGLLNVSWIPLQKQMNKTLTMKKVILLFFCVLKVPFYGRAPLYFARYIVKLIE